jgi:hypothetical protein
MKMNYKVINGTMLCPGEGICMTCGEVYENDTLEPGECGFCLEALTPWENDDLGYDDDTLTEDNQEWGDFEF